MAAGIQVHPSRPEECEQPDVRVLHQTGTMLFHVSLQPLDPRKVESGSFGFDGVVGLRLGVALVCVRPLWGPRVGDRKQQLQQLPPRLHWMES